MKPHQYPSNRRPGGLPSHDSAIERGRAKDDSVTVGCPAAGTTVVVTRHPALVDYLREIGLTSPYTQVITHATEYAVRDRHVIGVLPVHLAALAASVTQIPLDLPAELRGQELTLDQVRQYAGDPLIYAVITDDTPERVQYRREAALRA